MRRRTAQEDMRNEPHHMRQEAFELAAWLSDRGVQYSSDKISSILTDIPEKQTEKWVTALKKELNTCMELALYYGKNELRSSMLPETLYGMASALSKMNPSAPTPHAEWQENLEAGRRKSNLELGNFRTTPEKRRPIPKPPIDASLIPKKLVGREVMNDAAPAAGAYEAPGKMSYMQEQIQYFLDTFKDVGHAELFQPLRENLQNLVNMDSDFTSNWKTAREDIQKAMSRMDFLVNTEEEYSQFREPYGLLHAISKLSPLNATGEDYMDALIDEGKRVFTASHSRKPVATGPVAMALNAGNEEPKIERTLIQETAADIASKLDLVGEKIANNLHHYATLDSSQTYTPQMTELLQENLLASKEVILTYGGSQKRDSFEYMKARMTYAQADATLKSISEDMTADAELQNYVNAGKEFDQMVQGRSAAKAEEIKPDATPESQPGLGSSEKMTYMQEIAKEFLGQFQHAKEEVFTPLLSTIQGYVDMAPADFTAAKAEELRTATRNTMKQLVEYGKTKAGDKRAYGNLQGDYAFAYALSTLSEKSVKSGDLYGLMDEGDLQFDAKVKAAPTMPAQPTASTSLPKQATHSTWVEQVGGKKVTGQSFTAAVTAPKAAAQTGYTTAEVDTALKSHPKGKDITKHLQDIRKDVAKDERVTDSQLKQALMRSGFIRTAGTEITKITATIEKNQGAALSV